MPACARCASTPRSPRRTAPGNSEGRRHGRPPNAGVPRVSARAMWQRSCMPSWSHVQREASAPLLYDTRVPRARTTFSAWRGGSGSRGEDRPSVGLSPESRHGRPAALAGCCEPSPRAASCGSSTGSRSACSPMQDDRPVEKSWPPRAPNAQRGRQESPAGRLLHQHDTSGTGTHFTRLRPVVVGPGAAGVALFRFGVSAKALGLLPVPPVGRGLAIPMVHTVLHQSADGPNEPAADTSVSAAVSRAVRRQAGARAQGRGPAPPCRAPGRCAFGRSTPCGSAWLRTPDDGHEQPTQGAEPAPANEGPSVSSEVDLSMKDAMSGRTPVLGPRTVPGVTVRHRPVEARQCP
jgi:hypothetical protein